MIVHILFHIESLGHFRVLKYGKHEIITSSRFFLVHAFNCLHDLCLDDNYSTERRMRNKFFFFPKKKKKLKVKLDYNMKIILLKWY